MNDDAKSKSKFKEIIELFQDVESKLKLLIWADDQKQEKVEKE